MNEKELWERITSVESSAKSLHHRVDRMEHIMDSIHSLASEMRAMRNDFNNVLDRVQTIEQRPVRRYDTAVTAIITALVSAAVGYLIHSGV